MPIFEFCAKISIGQIAVVNLVQILSGGAQKILERALFPAVPVAARGLIKNIHYARYFVGGPRYLRARRSHGAESLGKDFSRRVLVTNAKILSAGRLCAESQISYLLTKFQCEIQIFQGIIAKVVAW